MASRVSYPIFAIGSEYCDIVGSFGTNGASGQPINVLGTGFTVVWTSTGLFTVTLTDNWPGGVFTITTGLQLAAAAPFVVQPGTVSLVAVSNYNYSTQVNKPQFPLTIFNTTTGTATDQAANANNRVSFVCTVKNLSAKVI